MYGIFLAHLSNMVYKMNPTDKELEAAAINHAHKNELTLTPIQLANMPWTIAIEGFKAGAHFERARILAMLRSAGNVVHEETGKCIASKEWAKWLESKLNEPSGAVSE